MYYMNPWCRPWFVQPLGKWSNQQLKIVNRNRQAGVRPLSGLMRSILFVSLELHTFACVFAVHRSHSARLRRSLRSRRGVQRSWCLELCPVRSPTQTALRRWRYGTIEWNCWRQWEDVLSVYSTAMTTINAHISPRSCEYLEPILKYQQLKRFSNCSPRLPLPARSTGSLCPPPFGF